MKIGNWNVARPTAKSRQRRIRDHLEQRRFDVLVLTESHDSLVVDYPEAISSEEGRDGFESVPGHRWVTLHSTYPLERIPVTDERRTVAALVKPDAASPFIVFGTVLPWIGSEWQGHPAADGAAFAAALETQRQDWQRIRKDYANCELFVIGDFNQDLVTPRYYGSAKNRTRLEESLNSVGLIALTSGAADPIRRMSPACACIDHICGVSDSRWRAVELDRWPDTATPDRGVSDHFGVAVTLR